MVLGYHVIISTYGFWLPNDPRGSWSENVCGWELVRFGKATKTDSRRSVAQAPHDFRLRLEAKKALRYPPVHLTGRQALAVAQGFDQARMEGNYVLHACTILPEHAHLVIARHDRLITRIIAHLKARATQKLGSENLWPADGRPVWSNGSWRVFLNGTKDMHRAVDYVQRNPEKEGKRRQRWSFVVPYTG